MEQRVTGFVVDDDLLRIEPFKVRYSRCRAHSILLGTASAPNFSTRRENPSVVRQQNFCVRLENVPRKSSFVLTLQPIDIDLKPLFSDARQPLLTHESMDLR